MRRQLDGLDQGGPASGAGYCTRNAADHVATTASYGGREGFDQAGQPPGYGLFGHDQ